MDEKKKGTNFTWPSAAVVAALAAGVLHSVSPLRSSRPEEKVRHENTARGDQVIQARLWQDPFAAVAAFRAAEAEKRAKLGFRDTNSIPKSENPELVEQVKRRFDRPTSEATNVTIFFVMVSNGPYVEDAERRMRTRYAVVSALGVAGYVPWDEDRIGYFHIQWPRGAAYEEKHADLVFSNTMADGLVVPYEWFQPGRLRNLKRQEGEILVMWLDSDAFKDHPAKRLAHLLGPLQEPSLKDRIRCKLLDPSLRELLQENWGKGFSVSNALKELQVYSSWSTTADALILTNISVLITNATIEPREAVREELGKRGFEFFNVTATDDAMTEELIEELARRGVDLSDPDNKVALISESDTFYGRALPLTFAANVRVRVNRTLIKNNQRQKSQPSTNFAEVISQLQSNPLDWPENIHLSSYLRGVDGRLPGEAPAKRESGNEKNKLKEAENLERPEGPSQLDYMPRLAFDLRENEQKEQRNGHSGFKAIGILGSDVYDKLLLLQSLHKLFPRTIFFTTDLDARLLHPSELKWSRNLIVASSFNLKIHDDDSVHSESPPPPFRDSYQVGQYLATLMAFDHRPTDYRNGVRSQLFEIGRNGPYILKEPRPKKDSDKGTGTIYPERIRWSPGWKAIVRTALALSFTCLLLGWYSGSIRRLSGSLLGAPSVEGKDAYEQRLCEIECGSTFWLRWLTAIFILAGGVLAFLICRDHHQSGGEPFSLFAGISLWPSEIFNLTATGLSCFFLVKAIYDLRRNETELAREFLLPRRRFVEETRAFWRRIRLRHWRRMQYPRIGEATPPLWGRLIAWSQYQAWNNFFRWECPGKDVNAIRLWGQNYRFGQAPNRFRRCLLATFFCFGLAVCLLYLFGLPFRPYRGLVNLWTDNILSMLCISSVVILIFFVVDATLLCNRFIELLSARATDWPPELLTTFHETRGMDRKDLPEWLDVQLIAKRTEAVGRLIFYPFIVLFLLIVSRNSFFDHFDWPVSILLLVGVLAVYAIFCALSLRRSAEKARQEELRQLNEKLLRARGEENKSRVEQILATIAEIKANEEGAFAPLSQHPIITAIAMPFGGAGIVTLLDYLALA